MNDTNEFIHIWMHLFPLVTLHTLSVLRFSSHRVVRLYFFTGKKEKYQEWFGLWPGNESNVWCNLGLIMLDDVKVCMCQSWKYYRTQGWYSCDFRYTLKKIACSYTNILFDSGERNNGKHLFRRCCAPSIHQRQSRMRRREDTSHWIRAVRQIILTNYKRLFVAHDLMYM